MALTDFLLARITEDEEIRVERYRNGYLPTPREIREADRWSAECEAKRRIVKAASALGSDGCDSRHDIEGHRILFSLALPYADHADFKEEWRA